MKTFIRRPGNKSKHLKHIIPLIPEFTGTYYEPFLGTGAVYLHLLPNKAVLNDLNKDIVNIWKLVKKNPEYIIQEIDKFKKKFLHLDNKEKLKMCKEIISKMDTYTGDIRTVNYLLMIYCSFSGCIILGNKWRTSSINSNLYSKNQCHVFTDDYIDKINVLRLILKNVKIENKDYRSILSKTKEGDFVFLDPPYIEEKTYVFSYNKNETFDICTLKTEVEKLDKMGVKWMMTQIDTNQVRDLFKNYNFMQYENNSSFLKGQVVKKEVIIMNY